MNAISAQIQAALGTRLSCALSLSGGLLTSDFGPAVLERARL
jgi:hypothetical protein